MQTAALIIAALFSVVAIVAAAFDTSTWISVASLVAAAFFLFLALQQKYQNMESEPVELDAEQRKTIKRMKSEGNFELAVKQVQMWFRNTSHDDAAAVVREV